MADAVDIVLGEVKVVPVTSLMILAAFKYVIGIVTIVLEKYAGIAPVDEITGDGSLDDPDPSTGVPANPEPGCAQHVPGAISVEKKRISEITP